MKFIVYRDGKIASDFKLSGAYMFGVDSIPLRSERKIEFKDGIIECPVKENETVGLSLMWQSKVFGNLLLSTTRLIERPRPYILNVELARAKLMQITLKREEWSLFDENDKIADFAKKAQAFFIEALKNINNPAKASVFADMSLQKSLIFSERLAAKYSEHNLAARIRSKSLARHSLGCKIDPELMVSDEYRKRLFEMFCFVTIPVSWARIEKSKGEYDFSDVDKILEFFKGRRFAICAGPLLNFDKENLPDWLLNEKYDFEKVREAAYAFVLKIVERYFGRIHAWNVISGINAQNHFNFNIEQTIEITRSACLAAKTSDPRNKSRKIVEVIYPWGEYYAAGDETIPPLVYADMVVQNGIPFDALGIEIEFGVDRDGCRVRDMMQISSRLDNFACLSKPLNITSISVPGIKTDGSGGTWHKPWSPAIQAEWIEQFYKIALGKSCVHSLTYSALADCDNMEVPESGLLDSSMEKKNAFISISKIQKIIFNK